MLSHTPASAQLEPISVLDTGPSFPMETLIAHEARAHALLDQATNPLPSAALRQLDKVSRRWLAKWKNAHLPEIDAIAARLARPGAYFLSVNYEWACTCRVAPSPTRNSARLVRVLDWRTPGLGRHVIAARVQGPRGRFVTLTWPGYTGVLTGMAPGRFSAALNQAPMRKAVGFYALDWAVSRRRVWTMPHPTPAHLLRSVFENAANYSDARDRLTREPISTPAIFSLAGIKASETIVIERTETDARVHVGPNVAANHWEAPGWRGRSRGNQSAERASMMHRIIPELIPDFSWLAPPILNPTTRIVMVSDASEGRLVAQGFEEMRPATQALDLTV
ncbi:hypothetical protein [Hyphomicrobium sp.]|uniref:hypothetical protein n=1 Tax=Hyphomicrobium sp. TaxID=82 RepID=UPI002E32AB65|nr:hypothetical protein [Hyphomicrobium sp.]HEX2840201.1 hypothetical protein [Hyphomicrobium sp.]